MNYRLLTYAWLAGQDETGQNYEGYRSFISALGFLELTRTKRGWTRTRELVSPSSPPRR